MSSDLEELKQFVRASLRSQFWPVPPQRSDSGKVHLEVWSGKRQGRPVGGEFGHKDRVNLWVRTAGDVPPGLPTSVDRTDKDPKGRVWTDAEGKGANSNLSAYDVFRTRGITRLGVKSKEDAQLVLEHLLR